MTKYIFGVVAILLIGGGVWWYLQLPGNKINTTVVSPAAPAPGEKPWVEVVTASVTTIDIKGSITTLQTGDEVTVGSVIKTNAEGVVVVHFPDGSFAKLDPNSSVTITATSYDASTGSSNVHMTLGTGTLWSKVLTLVGVNSSWQVETSNAVATVRGTSFMTSILKGKTKVVGIENKVAVTPLRPDTHEPLAIEANVTADTQVTIDDTHIAALASGKEQLASAPVSADVATSNAYKEFKVREEQFDTLRDSLKETLGDSAEFRKEFRESQVKDFEDKILERREKNTPLSEQTDIAPTEKTRVESSADTKKTDGKTDTKVDTARTSTETTADTAAIQALITDRTTAPIPKNSENRSDVHPVSLSVTPDRDLSQGMTENDTMTFRATLLFSDNTKKDVTDSVKWNVINNIGVFPTPGNFRAQPLSADAELGEVPGAVYATFVGSDGKELNAASKLFIVYPYVPQQTTTDG
ncbi:MAG: FecR domain-containing protein [bacterium]|nr:FecR domain-containing protein [bacterium]